jgi:hypothetical protein
MTHLLDSRAKRISNLEAAAKESAAEKSDLVQTVELLKLKVQSGDSRAGLETELAKVVKERNLLQTEIINLKMEAAGSKDRVSGGNVYRATG